MPVGWSPPETVVDGSVPDPTAKKAESDQTQEIDNCLEYYIYNNYYIFNSKFVCIRTTSSSMYRK